MEHNKVNKEEEIIELRSENTRRFIGEVPPKLLRIGTVVITIIVIVFAMLVYLMRYKGEPLWRIVFH